MAAGRKVVIEFLGQDKTLGRTMNDLDGKSGRLTGALAKVGKMAAAGLAIGAVAGGAALVKMTQGAIEDEAAQKRLEQQLKNSAGATDKQVASVEKWISAQGKALGVTDDELRPALSKLVTATGDVGKAQDLASLAMDVSAAKGKDLGAVSEALMKAQNGQVGALSRLGINTKNAAGETIGMEEAVKRMSAQFGGAAATQANTLEGKMGRLKLILAETGETIGSKLIPYVTQMADWFLNRGLPALTTFGNYLGTVFPPIWERIRTVISTVMGSLQGDVSGNLGKVRATFQSVTSIISSLWDKFGGTILDYAKKTFANMRQVIGGALTVIQGVFQTFAALLKGDWSGAWDGVKKILSGAWEVIKGVVRQALNVVSTLIEVAWTAVKGITSRAWDGIKEAVSNGIGRAIDSLRGIPEKAKAALGALGSTLRSAGEALIQGLIDGISSKVAALRDKLQSVTKLIPDWKGPLDKDKILLTPAGVALMEGLIKGIDKGKVKLQTVLEKVTDYIQKKQDNLASLLEKRQSIVDSFRGFTQSVFGTDTGTEGSPATAQSIVDFGAGQRAKAEQLNANIGALIAKGLSKDLIQQMVDQGQSGIDQINTLATATDAQIQALNANNAATVQALTAAGLTTANALLQDQIDGAARDVALADSIRDKLAELLDKQDKNTIVQLNLDGKIIRASLLRLKRESGKELGLT